MSLHLSSRSQHIFDQVFQHPLTHNLEWGDVRSLFEDLGTVVDQHNGNMHVTWKGENISFSQNENSTVLSADEVMRVRHFLTETESRRPSANPRHLLVVIDHHEARIFRTELKDGVPETVILHDTDGHKAHVHSAHDFRDHTEGKNYDDYFEEIAKTLSGSERVLIFGSGKGSSSASHLFAAWLKETDAELFSRVDGPFTVDESHLTDAELLAKARHVYNSPELTR